VDDSFKGGAMNKQTIQFSELKAGMRIECQQHSDVGQVIVTHKYSDFALGRSAAFNTPIILDKQLTKFIRI
jgi:hypothetical protein